MKKEEFVKILKESFSFGLAGLGIYNILLLVGYFKNGMDKSIIPVNIDLFVADIAIVAIITFILIILNILIRIRKFERSDGSGTEK